MAKITTWVKIGDRFINQDNIQAIKRQGKGTLISRILGNDISVGLDYDKVKALLPPEN